MISHGICLSLSDLLHLVWSSPVASMLLKMALFHSFFNGWVVFLGSSWLNSEWSLPSDFEKNLLWVLSLSASQGIFQVYSWFLPHVSWILKQQPYYPQRAGFEVARPATIQLVVSKSASLTCQGKQDVSPDVTHFPSSSCQVPLGFEPQLAHLLSSVKCLWRGQDALRCQ